MIFTSGRIIASTHHQKDLLFFVYISKTLKPFRTVVDPSRKRSTTDIPSEEAMSPTSKSRYNLPT